MKYWPLSVLTQSPLINSAYVPELCRVYDTGYMSHGVFNACGAVASQTKPVETPLVIIESVGAPMRRAYSSMPTFEAWARLERGGFVATEDGFFGFMIDALH